MALTLEEEKELAELEQEFGNKQSNLTPEEERELASLEQEFGNESTKPKEPTKWLGWDPVTDFKKGQKAYWADRLDKIAGTGETALTMATGAIGGAAGLLGGIASHPFVGDEKSKEFEEFVTDYYTHKPRSVTGQKAVELIGKIAQPLRRPRELATEIGGEQWGRVADVAMLGIGSAIPKIGSAVKAAPQKIGTAIYRKTLQPAGTLTDARAMAKTGFEGKFWLTRKGEAHLKEVKGAFDRTLNQIMAEHGNKPISINKVIPQAKEQLMKYAVDTELPITHIKSIERLISQQEQMWMARFPNGEIPASSIQKFKQNIYQRYNNSYGEVKKAMSTEGAKALGRSAKNALDDVIPDLRKVNPHEAKLIQFKEQFEKTLANIENQHLSINNTIINNTHLLTGLARVFRAMSPDHLYANPAKLKAYLKDIPSPTVANVYNNAQIEWSRQMGMADESGRAVNWKGEVTGNVTPLVRPTMKAIGYDKGILPKTSPIEQGVEYASGRPKVRDYTPEEWVGIQQKMKAEFNNPEFWNKNKDLTNLLLKIQNKKPILEGEMNTLLYRVMQGIPAKQSWYERPQKPLIRTVEKPPTPEVKKMPEPVDSKFGRTDPDYKITRSDKGEVEVKPSKELTLSATERRVSTFDEQQVAFQAKEKLESQRQPFKPANHSLFTWIRQQDGINYNREHMKGELKDLPASLLNKKDGGLTLDYLRESAVEAGFIGRKATLNEFMQLIDTEARGTKVFSSRGTEERLHKTLLARDKETASKVSVFEGDLESGANLYINKEKYTVKRNKDGTVSLIDGEIIKLDHFDRVEIDRNRAGYPKIEKPEKFSLGIQEGRRVEGREPKQMGDLYTKQGFAEKLTPEEVKAQAAGKVTPTLKGQKTLDLAETKTVDEITNAIEQLKEQIRNEPSGYKLADLRHKLLQMGGKQNEALFNENLKRSSATKGKATIKHKKFTKESK